MNTWNRLPLRVRILLILGVLALTTGGTISVTIWYSYRVESLTARTIQISVASLRRAERLKTSLSSQRGYLSYYFMDGDQHWLSELERSRKDFDKRLREAREFEEVEDARRVLDRITSEYDRYTDSKNRVIELYKIGNRAAGANLHRQIRGRFFDILKLCEEYSDIHEQGLDAVLANSSVQAKRFRIIAVAAITAEVVIIALLSFVLIVQILEPIRKLAGEADRTGGSVSESDEIAALSRGVVNLIGDVSRTRKALQRQNEFLIRVLESMSHPFYVINADSHKIELANSASRTEGSPEGVTCHELTHGNSKPCGPEECPCPLEEVKRTRKSTVVEHLHFVRGGEARYFEVHCHPILDDEGNVARVIEYSIDITKRKKAEQALRGEKERAQQYLDVAGAMFVVIDSHENVTLINKKGSAVLGCKDCDIIGKNWFDNFVPERIREDVREVFRKLMSGDIEPVEYFENPVLTGEGEERIIAWHNAILTDEAGKIVGTLGSGEDITARKHAEEQLRKYQDGLEKLVEARTGELTASNEHLRLEITERERAEDELRESETRYRRLSESLEETVEKKVAELQQAESLAAIGRMVAVVAHEVRNPLQNIKLGVEMLRGEAGEDRDTIETLEGIDYGINLLNGLVQDLLDYSRPITLQYSLSPMRSIIEQALKMLNHKLGNISTHVEIEQEDRRMPVDKARLTSVLVNLISNAADAMPDGGDLHINSKFSDDAGTPSLEISISDNGCGIDEEHLKRVSEPFFTTKRKGTGLGIPICKKIIDAHHGSMEIKSKVGDGTTVVITLPARNT